MRMFVPFTGDGEILRIGRGLLDRTLPKAEWTHAAHFSAALWLLTDRPLDEVAAMMPGAIRAYNEASGVMNTDSSGYHETITLASLRAAADFLARSPRLALFESCNELMRSELGEPGWLFRYWTRERLFSVAARRAWVEPDLEELPF
jgi:hypothetical protein